MKAFHSVCCESAVIGYKILWRGCHAVQQCLEAVCLSLAVKKLLAFEWCSILIQLNTMLFGQGLLLAVQSHSIMYLLMVTPGGCVHIKAVVRVKIHNGLRK